MATMTASLGERMAQDSLKVLISPSYEGESPSQMIPRSWRIVIRMRRRIMCLPYWSASSVDRPSPEEVMATLLQEARSMVGGPSFEAWCARRRGDPRDIRVEHAYYTAMSQTDCLHHVLGDLYHVYLRLAENL